METINKFIHSLVPSKTIPDSRPKWRKNPTRWRGTYLHGLYKGVPPLGPPPIPGGSAVPHIFVIALLVMQCLPFQYLLPCTLVVSIVNFDDIFHVMGLNLVILPFPAFTQHCIPKHLLRWVNPVITFIGPPSGNS